jgi:hypothetical protein
MTRLKNETLHLNTNQNYEENYCVCLSCRKEKTERNEP